MTKLEVEGTLQKCARIFDKHGGSDRLQMAITRGVIDRVAACEGLGRVHLASLERVIAGESFPANTDKKSILTRLFEGERIVVGARTGGETIVNAGEIGRASCRERV